MSLPQLKDITDAVFSLLDGGASGAIVNAVARPANQFGVNTITAPDDTQLPCVLILAPQKTESSFVFPCTDLGNYKVEIQVFDERMAGAHSAETLHDSVVADIESQDVNGMFAYVETTEGPTQTEQFIFSTITVILENR